MRLSEMVGGVASGRFPGRVLLTATELLRGSRSIALVRELQQEAIRSPEEVRERQWQRLSQLLVHAAQQVPYYREMFRQLGASPHDVKSFDDYARLPILTKDVVRDRWRDLIAVDRSPDKLVRGNTGGSTGTPLTFYRDREYLRLSVAGTYRLFAQAGWQPGEMIAFFWGGNPRLDRMSRPEFEIRQYLRRMYQFDPFKSGDDDLRDWLRRWPRIRPTVAYGYASTVARFARFIGKNDVRVPPLKGVFTTAERLYPAQREEIERAFATRVYDCYGTSEVHHIAAECRNGSMHVSADFVHLEVVGSTSANEPSPLLVTSLRNYAMPFLRYRTEDLGALADGTCSCGSGFPLMTLGVARTSDNFVLPNGRVVHGEFFTHLLYGVDGVAAFQFHQTSRDHIVLYWVPVEGGRRETPNGAFQSIVQQIEGLAPGLVRVSVQAVDAIPLTSAGKYRFTRSDVTDLN